MLEKGLLRVGGRLSKAVMPDGMKHPVILAKDQHISTLILRYIHEQLGHCGRNHLLSRLRQQYCVEMSSISLKWPFLLFDRHYSYHQSDLSIKMCSYIFLCLTVMSQLSGSLWFRPAEAALHSASYNDKKRNS